MVPILLITKGPKTDNALAKIVLSAAILLKATNETPTIPDANTPAIEE